MGFGHGIKHADDDLLIAFGQAIEYLHVKKPQVDQVPYGSILTHHGYTSKSRLFA